jgi:hypothetical protein
MKRFRNSVSYANVMATVAVFVALGGGAYAAIRLPKNSVGTRQIKNGAVNSTKVKNGSLLSSDFKVGQLPAGGLGPQGPRGDSGPQGLTGDSGPAGPKGDTGAAGAQGPKGDSGATGAQGPKGDTGATGAQGPAAPPGGGTIMGSETSGIGGSGDEFFGPSGVSDGPGSQFGNSQISPNVELKASGLVFAFSGDTSTGSVTIGLQLGRPNVASFGVLFCTIGPGRTAATAAPSRPQSLPGAPCR